VDGAGERNHEHLTALAAAIAVQPCIHAARRDEILMALEVIAGGEYVGEGKETVGGRGVGASPMAALPRAKGSPR